MLRCISSINQGWFVFLQKDRHHLKYNKLFETEKKKPKIYCIVKELIRHWRVSGWARYVVLLVQNDFTTSSHILTGLSGTFVLAGLETDHSFTGNQDILGEFTLVLFCWSRTQERALPLGVSVGLVLSIKCIHSVCTLT